MLRERHDALYTSERGHAVPGPSGSAFTLLTPILCDRLLRRAAETHSPFEIGQWHASGNPSAIAHSEETDEMAREEGEEEDADKTEDNSPSQDHQNTSPSPATAAATNCGEAPAPAHHGASASSGSMGRSSVHYVVTKHNTLIVDSHSGRSLRDNADECMRHVCIALHEASYRPPPAAPPQKANQHVIRKAIQQRQMRSNRNKLNRSLSRGARVSSTKW
jgi:hypothetical protein